MRVFFHARFRNLCSKIHMQNSGLCYNFEVSGSLLTLHELDMQRIFTASHDSVYRSTIARPAVRPVPDARSKPLLLAPHAAPPTPTIAPPQPTSKLPLFRQLFKLRCRSPPLKSYYRSESLLHHDRAHPSFLTRVIRLPYRPSARQPCCLNSHCVSVLQSADLAVTRA